MICSITVVFRCVDGDVFPSYGANELAAMTFELSKKLIADHSVTQGAGSAEQIAAPYLGVRIANT